MTNDKMLNFLKDVLENTPTEWLTLTTHRLDIYNEKLAKSQFLEGFEALFQENNTKLSSLSQLPTAFDYIRLGHPLSSILEWAIAQSNNTYSKRIISFSSITAPILAVLRKNLVEKKNTLIYYTGDLPHFIDIDHLRNIYGYQFDVKQVETLSTIKKSESQFLNQSVILISQPENICVFEDNLTSENQIDFFINIHATLGSIIMVNGKMNDEYISEIQHVRRRETIAMTPSNCMSALKSFVKKVPNIKTNINTLNSSKRQVLDSIVKITSSSCDALVASSGLSIQYAILMGLIHNAMDNYKGKAIKIIVPPNCYGGTNDQARRVAICLKNVDVVDLPVDGGSNMVESIDSVLDQIAQQDGIPFIIAEIPTNPRVEVPDLIKLRDVLGKERTTKDGKIAVDPVFILDQTFCPNVHFVGKGDILSTIKTISFASGSKFPSGGLCTAGYCVANSKAEQLMEKIKLHLSICDNEATELQYEILAQQLPSMNQRIHDAYLNTRAFVNFIKQTLPEAKINFVSEELASIGFTPSVFSLDLPSHGNSAKERETNKRALNHQLINLMISSIPKESKYCVSYGQLRGCYWTIPATSTQGTTKESDKDYIARVAVSPDLDLDLHKKVFSTFVNNM